MFLLRCDFLELIACVWVLVRVELEGQLTVGLLQVTLRNIRRNTQHIIQLSVFHHRCWRVGWAL